MYNITQEQKNKCVALYNRARQVFDKEDGWLFDPDASTLTNGASDIWFYGLCEIFDLDPELAISNQANFRKPTQIKYSQISSEVEYAMYKQSWVNKKPHLVLVK